MNQREQFEQWWLDNTDWIGPPNPMILAWEAWQDAQAAKDAEMQELRANLAKCREFIKSVENYPQSTFISNMKNWSHYKQAREACGL